MSADLPLSVLLLVRDETRDVEELLPTLAFAREVVVVWDPRGAPAARETAVRLGARVFERAFDGFGPQRQFALEQCTQDWVLWIDADERLAPGAEQELRALVADLHVRVQYWGICLRRATWFLGARIHHCGWGHERVLRLFRREATRFDDAPVHERVEFVPTERRVPGSGRTLPDEPTTTFAAALLEHHSYRTWADCRVKLERYAGANAEKAWRAGRRAGLLDEWLRPPLRFVRQYVLQLGFLDGWRGLVLCGFAAAQVARKYRLLRARSRGAGAGA